MASSPNAIQQVFNPNTQRILLRVGLYLGIAIVLALVVALIIKLFKSATGSGTTDTGSGVNADGTPATTPSNIKRLADDLNATSGWFFGPCYAKRCDTILAMAELPDSQLLQMGKYYQDTYSKKMKDVFASFTFSGCCFRDAESVVEAKLAAVQQKVKALDV